MRRWSEESIAQALRDWAAAHGGKAPSWEQIKNDPSMPSPTAFHRWCGGFANACVLAGFEGNPVGSNGHKDDDTAEVYRRIMAGATLTEIAAEQGITGQALGRRLRRWCNTFGVEPPGLYPGRRSTTGGKG